MGGCLNSVILKIAERCNLNCSYCYLYNHEDDSWKHRAKFMSDEVYDAMLVAMTKYCERRPGLQMNIVYHGGEPLLIDKKRFDELCQKAKSVLKESLRGLSIQTNGTLLDEEWAALFIANDVHVGVSLDGPPTIHDAVRVYHSGTGSHSETVRGLKILQDYGIDAAVLCVIDPGSSGLAAYRHFRELGVRTMNFLLPDVSHDNKERLYGRYGATPVADYLIPIFDEWFYEDDAAIRIRLFWGLLRMLMGGIGETDVFGNPEMHYVVVETDGSIEPLDALRVCENGLTQVGLNVLRHGFDDLDKGKRLLNQLVHSGLPLPTACGSCPEREICGGGYYPHRYSKVNGFDNPSVWCADILKLMEHLRSHVPSDALVGN